MVLAIGIADLPRGVEVPDIHDVLSHLSPPIKHHLEQHSERFTLRLCDERLGIEAVRNLNLQEFLNKSQFRTIVLYAVNVLRSKGSHVELAVLLHWD
ncbi:hypothetical protein SFA35_25300 (plasmid) [Pseudomonas sp. HR96]|uniref:hypothetical protein n=1 Tax=Pseudomonas sp. HR96 TaxID=1027966 RepID=UPI002A765ACA|nr:hypothetical protein [Pseudomonas sp. HR96]WPP02487.1 hypothetical protein SFA35_25300 [Pseudomonas sp. HR96]